MQPPSYLNVLLEEDTLYALSSLTVHLHAQHVADVPIPSGQLVVCDPFVDIDITPFLLSFEPGIYPVIITSIEIPPFEHTKKLIGAASVRFSNEAVEHWNLARRHGKPSTDREEHCFYVDGATGCFMDQQVALVHRERLANDRDSQYTQYMADLMAASQWTWTVMYPDPTSKLACIAFATGEDDGTYPCYVGFDRNGQVAVLIADFLILPSLE